jgi:UDP-N-acetylmuramoyl-tripeptide--D-alanyl-D-alanine ligase
MFEMGAESEAEHRALGDVVAQQPFDTDILCGKDMQHAAGVKDSFLYYETKPELQTWLGKNPVAESYVLIKVSRGIGLETLVEELG